MLPSQTTSVWDISIVRYFIYIISPMIIIGELLPHIEISGSCDIGKITPKYCCFKLISFLISRKTILISHPSSLVVLCTLHQIRVANSRVDYDE